MNEDLVRHLAEKNHDAWRNNQANAKSRWNVPFGSLPEDKQTDALAEIRTTIEEYEKTMTPKQPPAQAVQEVKKQSKGAFAMMAEKLNPPKPQAEEVAAEPQEEPAVPTQTAPTAAPAMPASPLERIDSALRFIAVELRNLSDENERRRLATLSIQSIAFNAANGDALLGAGILDWSARGFPSYCNAVIGQRQTVNQT